MAMAVVRCVNCASTDAMIHNIGVYVINGDHGLNGQMALWEAMLEAWNELNCPTCGRNAYARFMASQEVLVALALIRHWQTG